MWLPAVCGDGPICGRQTSWNAYRRAQTNWIQFTFVAIQCIGIDSVDQVPKHFLNTFLIIMFYENERKKIDFQLEFLSGTISVRRRTTISKRLLFRILNLANVNCWKRRFRLNRNYVFIHYPFSDVHLNHFSGATDLVRIWFQNHRVDYSTPSCATHKIIDWMIFSPSNIYADYE